MSRQDYARGQTFDEYVDAAETYQELWRALRGRALVPPELLARVEAIPGRWHLLGLSGDWCGDAVNTVPTVAALAAEAGNLELRLLDRDQNPELMDSHLTGTSRSIPVIIVLDDRFREWGWWGPRPRALQEWVLGEGRQLPPDERYRRVRAWYARDRGRTALEELVTLLETAARRRLEAA